MMLDIRTLLVVNAANLLLMASILPFIMGRRVSPAAAHARASLVMQALGWLAIILAGFWIHQWPDHLLSTVSMACLSASQWLTFQALQGWLGRRRGQTLLLWLVLLTPIGYALTFQNYPVRVGWSNLMLALQLLIVCQAALRPQSGVGGAWRWVAFGCALTMAAFTAARGVMGAFFTELYPTFQAPHPVNLMAMLAANVTLVLGNLTLLVAWHEEAEALLREQAQTDGLTGLLNRHGWDERAPALYDQARRHANPLALIMLDLDHFKRINDTRGHEVGDQVLRMLGQVLQANRRSSDLVARYGGEEFVVLLPQTDEAAARLFEQRLRHALKQASLRQPELAVDYSAGLALLQATDAGLTGLLGRADQALYQVKRQGRGNLQIAPALPIAKPAA